MVSRNNQILSEIFSMNDGQLAKFIEGLKPDTLEYLDILLEKAEKDPTKLKKYLRSNG